MEVHLKILIDTNIFHNSYYIKSIDLRLILSFINNEEHELLLSDIVLKEVEKHFIDGYTSARDKLSSALNEYNRFFPLGDETKVEHLEGFTENDDRNPVKYNFQRQLNKYIDPNKIVIVNSDKVSHNSICNKAFYNKKPFKKDGSGYKDSLIWFSFLEYLADNEIDEEVAFVSNNWKDFSADDKGVKEDKDVCIFHDDLIEDIASYGVKAEIKHFNTISNLISHYGIVNDKYPASYVDVKSYVENGFFDSHLITFLEDSFFKKHTKYELG
ncbi:hypothetical protein B4916_12025 [Yersinia intermedia]|nr:hypothetical protein B4916_12025 [Yersinia intermedia]